MNIKQLTCQPPLPIADFIGDYAPTDEVAEFRANPKRFLDDVLHDGYDGIMMFDNAVDDDDHYTAAPLGRTHRLVQTRTPRQDFFKMFTCS